MIKGIQWRGWSWVFKFSWEDGGKIPYGPLPPPTTFLDGTALGYRAIMDTLHHFVKHTH